MKFNNILKINALLTEENVILKDLSGIFCDVYGSIIHLKQGLFHNNNGPAIKYPEGDREWIVNGERHRLDGPAMEYSDGEKIWYKNGKIHRINGPAVEYPNGSKYWFIKGMEYSEEEYYKK